MKGSTSSTMACRETEPSLGVRTSMIGSGRASHSVPSQRIRTATVNPMLAPDTSIAIAVAKATDMLDQGREGDSINLLDTTGVTDA